MIHRDIVLLVYQNRSGSTFLANQLSRHPAIAVPPEGHDALQRLLGQTGPGVALPARIERAARDLADDPKLRSWQIAPETFAARARDAQDSLDAFFALCDSFADEHQPGATTVVVKGEFLRDLIARHGFAALSRHRRTKAIFLLRDPRATFASQRKSISSNTGLPMQQSALVAALRWQQGEDIARKLATGADGLVMHYDALILDHDKVMREVAAFLDVDPAPFFGEGSADTLKSRIPPEQRHLHTNVDKAPLTHKVDAWRAELSRREIALIDRLAARGMARSGYAPVPDARLGMADAPWLAGAALSAALRLVRPSRLFARARR